MPKASAPLSARPRHVRRRAIFRLSTMKSRSASVDLVGSLPKPDLRLCERETHQHCLTLCAVRCREPSATRGFEPGSPGEKLALGSDPVAQLLPAAEHRLMRHFDIRFPTLGRCRD